MSDKLGEMLLNQKVISEAQLKDALEKQSQIGGKLGTILTKLRYLTEDQLATLLGQQLKIPVLGLRDLVVEHNVSALVDLEILEKHQVLPVSRTGDTLLVAAVDPLDLNGIDDLQFLTGLRIETAAVSRTNFRKALDYYFHNKPCPEIRATEKTMNENGARKSGVETGTRVAPAIVLQALTELLIEKQIIAHEDLLSKLADKGH